MMVLSTSSLRTPPEELIAQRDALDRELAKHVADELEAKRKAWADELAACKISGNGDLPALTAAVKQADEALKVAQAKLRHAEVDRATQVRLAGERADWLRGELLLSAPAEIDVAERELQKLLADAIAAQKNAWREEGDERIRYSNSPTVEPFVAAAGNALRALRDLRLVALDPKKLAREIKAIVGALPAAEFPLVEV